MGGLEFKFEFRHSYLGKLLPFVNQNRNEQASQTVAENEDVTQSSNVIQEE